ncbi:MAG: hypothetical protein MJZ75_04210 [Paludibacteraceae bacterium]|nr:hypothetical protein [Paludibacteraceae bacterium]
MKKTILLFAFLGITIFGYSQEVKVNINNENATVKDECPYRINGICSTDDIGGVDVEFSRKASGQYNNYVVNYYLTLTNYNSFPVNVLWKISFHGGKIKTGSNMLGVDGQKVINYYIWGSDFYDSSLEGLIVRKLTQNDEK